MRMRVVAVAVFALAALAAPLDTVAAGPIWTDGVIEGHVTEWGTGDPVEGVEVRGWYTGQWSVAYTDATGFYHLDLPEADDYRLYFIEPGEYGAFRYYPGTYQSSAATIFTVTDDETWTGIDATVQFSGDMAGRVTDENTGLPVAGACADIHDMGGFVATAVSDADGWFRYPGVTVDVGDNWLDTEARIYDCDNLGFMDVVDHGIVEYGTRRGRFAAQVAPPGDIGGTVTGLWDSPVSGICVSLWAGATELEREVTDSEGWYDFSGFASGTYELDFEDCNDPINYVPVFDVPVTIVGGHVTYHDQSLEWASTISGVVTDAATGLPVQGICVLGTEEWFQGSRFFWELTDALGRYTLIVPAGTEHQYVRAYWCDPGPAAYGEQWWDGAATFEEATDLQMVALEQRTGVDIAMPKMASLQGTLTGADGLPAQTAILLDPQFEGASWWPAGSSEADGTYRIDNIEPGAYRVRFGDDGVQSTYAAEWYDDVLLEEDGAEVVFDWAEVITIDAELAQMGGFEWQFLLYASPPNPVVCAYATDADGEVISELAGGGNDSFQIGGLNPGDYLIYVEDCDQADPRVAPSWYPGEPSRASAAFVTVANDWTDLGDWWLASDIPGPSTISGEVHVGGEPENACVAVYDQDMTPVASVVAAGGAYSVDGLTLHGPAAALLVKAADCSDPSRFAWYGGPTEAEAEAIPFGLGMEWSGIDIELPALAAPPPEFVDDDGTTFESDIEWLAAAGVTRGCNPPVNDMFCPDAPVTRGQMAAFLSRALDLKDRLDDPFVDDDGSTFEADIEKLAAAGITRGCNPPTNDRFCPSDLVTRGQMAAFLVRALDYTDAGEGDLFTDDDGSIFENAIDKLATAGVTRGCNPPANDRFCPSNVVTRGQMAAFLHRALG